MTSRLTSGVAALLLAAVSCQLFSSCTIQPAAPASSTTQTTARPINPEPEVITQAEDAGFDYRDTLAKAEAADVNAVTKLVEFSPSTDAAGALAHGWVLLALKRKIGNSAFDRAFSEASLVSRTRTVEIMNVAGTYEGESSQNNVVPKRH